MSAKFVGMQPDEGEIPEPVIRLVHKETVLISRFVVVNDRDEMVAIGKDQDGDVFEMEVSAKAGLDESALLAAMEENAAAKEKFLKSFRAALRDAARAVREQLNRE